MSFLSRFLTRRSDPRMLERLHQAKGLIEDGFNPTSYDTGTGEYCAIGAYAKTFAGSDHAGNFLAEEKAIEGFKVLDEATFIITGGQWKGIEGLAMRTRSKALVLRAYDKAIELVEMRTGLTKAKTTEPERPLVEV